MSFYNCESGGDEDGAGREVGHPVDRIRRCGVQKFGSVVREEQGITDDGIKWRKLALEVFYDGA